MCNMVGSGLVYRNGYDLCTLNSDFLLWEYIDGLVHKYCMYTFREIWVFKCNK